jgi:mRNA interferase MazF
VVIEQGDVVWVDLGARIGSEPAGRRPAVVLQTDRFNRTALRTIVVAAVTSNVRLARMPGNVALAKGEAGLPRRSVVNVTQMRALDRDRIVGRAGKLTRARLLEVWSGLRLLLEPALD